MKGCGIKITYPRSEEIMSELSDSEFEDTGDIYLETLTTILRLFVSTIF